MTGAVLFLINIHKLRVFGAQGQSAWLVKALHHFESVCGMVPARNRSQSRPGPGRSVNELNQNLNNCDSGTSLTSISRYSEHENFTNMVPRQVLDVVNIANNHNNSGKNLQHHLELDTLSTSTHPAATPVKSQPTQIFLNIEIDGVLVYGKQDTGAEINAMPLNVYDQLNQKLDGKLELKSCNNIKVIGYSKQSVNIMGKITVTYTHATTIKKVNFYVTDIVDTKVILGLQFFRAFNLVQINCDDSCVCKQIAVDVINSEFSRGLDPEGNPHSTKSKL